jgi:hypothetical protein
VLCIARAIAGLRRAGAAVARTGCSRLNTRSPLVTSATVTQPDGREHKNVLSSITDFHGLGMYHYSLQAGKSRARHSLHQDAAGGSSGPQMAGCGGASRPARAAASTGSAPGAGRQACPACGAVMVRRMARQGAYVGHEFWGARPFLHAAAGCRSMTRCRSRRDRPCCAPHADAFRAGAWPSRSGGQESQAQLEGFVILMAAPPILASMYRVGHWRCAPPSTHGSAFS